MPESYTTVLAHYIAVTGHEPESDWAAFFYLVCASGLWERVKPLVHFAAAPDDPEGFRGVEPAVLEQVPLSRGERLILQMALHLYNPRNPSPALSDLATTLDDRHYQAVLAALAEYRARVRSPG